MLNNQMLEHGADPNIVESRLIPRSADAQAWRVIDAADGSAYGNEDA